VVKGKYVNSKQPDEHTECLSDALKRHEQIPHSPADLATPSLPTPTLTERPVSSTNHPENMERKRRNRQLSSCEPCRKSKLRCDHTWPICNRCIRHGRTDKCFYHPAPVTKPCQIKAAVQSQNQDPSASDSIRDLSVSSTVSGSSAAHLNQ
jgi:hypothetical protein